MFDAFKDPPGRITGATPFVPLRRAGVLAALGLLACGRAMAQAAAPVRSSDPLGSPSTGGAGMELVVLGSGGPGATGRAGAGYLVLVGGVPRLLVDAGPGTFVRLGESGLSLQTVDTVLLTHLHVDHAGELPGLLKARAVGGVQRPVRIFGPVGQAAGKDRARFPSTTAFVDGLFGPSGVFAYLRDFAAPLRWRTTDIGPSARTAAPRRLFDEGGLVVTALAGHHGDAPSVIYRVEHDGRSITFSGDIDPAGHAALRRLAQASSLLVFNAVVLDPPGSPPVLYGLHTAPRAIGEVAAQARVGRLLLSHLSPAVENGQQDVLASVRQRYQGPVVFARDGLRLAP